MEILRAIAIGMVVALSCVGSATAATYGGAKDVQEISGSVGISSGNITIANSTFSVVNSTVGVVQAGAFTISNSTFGARQQGVWNTTISTESVIRIADSEGHVANIDSQGRLFVNTSISAGDYYGGVTPIISNGINKDTDFPVVLMVNPSTSTKRVLFQKVGVAVTLNTATCIFKLLRQPSVISSGTIVNIVGLNTSTPTAVELYTSPTVVSVNLPIVDAHYQAKDENMYLREYGGIITLLPGTRGLVTANCDVNNATMFFNVKWIEEE